MQIKVGTCIVTNGNSLISSSVDADWSQVTVGCLFSVIGRDSLYFVNESAVYDATLNSGAGGWKVHLSTNYGQTTGSALDYMICRDFSPYYSIPLLTSGDVETAAIFTRAMQIIDAMIKLASTTGGTPGTETTYTKVSHGFNVGTVVRIDGSGVFQIADSTTEANSRIVGMVKTIVDADNFVLQTDGLVTGVTGITLVSGTPYYLKNTATAVNITSNTTTEIVLKVPVFVALTSSSGVFFMSGALATTDFTAATGIAAGVHGLVPPPPIGAQVKFLRGDATFADALPADNTLLFRHLKTTPAFTTSDWLAIDPTDSVYNALINLATRLAAIDFVRYSFKADFDIDPLADASINGAWKCPAGVVEIKITAVGGGGAGGKSNSSKGGSGGGSGEYIEALIAVSPDTEYAVIVGSGGTWTAGLNENGNNTSFQDASGYLLVAKGGNVGKNYNQSSEASAGTGGTGGSVTGTVLLRVAGKDGEFYTISPAWAGAGGNCVKGGAGGRYAKGVETAPTTTNKLSRPGNSPGGAGSGAFKLSGANPFLGGHGGAGFLRIEWN